MPHPRFADQIDDAYKQFIRIKVDFADDYKCCGWMRNEISLTVTSAKKLHQKPKIVYNAGKSYALQEIKK